MTGRKTCAFPPVVPYRAFGKFSKALYGTKGGTYRAHVFRPVMGHDHQFTSRDFRTAGIYNLILVGIFQHIFR